MKKVSVIIPVFNVSPYLENCLNSCLRQTLDDVEIILVNDGSIDNSPEIVAKYVKKYDNILFVNQENSGVVKTRERGLQLASGEYIYYLDGDDFLPDNVLLIMFDNAKKNESDIVFGDVNILDENHKLIKYLNYGSSTFRSGQDLLAWIVENKVGYLWGKLIKKDLYKTNEVLKFYEMEYCEDLIEMLQLSNFSARVSKIDMPSYNYIQREGSVCTSRASSVLSANRYSKILTALDNLMQSNNFFGAGLLNVKLLYVFYSVLYVWFSKGMIDNKTNLKSNMLQVVKDKQVKRTLWAINKKWYFLSSFTFKFPVAMSKGYELYIDRFAS